jgi:hypothetical protein
MNAPNPEHLDSCDTLRRKLNYVGYIVSRMKRLGLGKTLRYVRERVVKRFAGAAGSRTKSPHKLAELAVRTYRPPTYEGNVLLLLASEHPPHVDFARGWPAVVRGELHIHYLQAHSRDLLTTENLRTAAEIIVSHLTTNVDSRRRINRYATSDVRLLTATS